MRQTPTFEMPITWEVDGDLARPDDDRAAEWAFEGNEHYHDLRPLDWSDAAIALDRDRKVLAHFLAGDAIPSELLGGVVMPDENEDFEITDHDLFDAMFAARDALDAGVAGAVAALAASGCTPFSSCNGAAFGGMHSSVFPVIRFFAPAHIFVGIVECAKMAGVGLEVDGLGRVEVFARKIEDMIAFAEALTSRFQ